MAVGWPTKTTYANGDVYSASDVNDTNGTINLLQTSTLSMQQLQKYLAFQMLFNFSLHLVGRSTKNFHF